MSGALSVNGEPGTGRPSSDPARRSRRRINGRSPSSPRCIEREHDGRGRYIDISLMDWLIGMLGYIAQLAFFTGETPSRRLAASQSCAYGSFPAKDGSIIVACLTNGFWAAFATALGCPETTADPPL
jgi:crotonobetainyl-CoA:carnitine CoA-transferase CaiB-like acyl-CoA transferase